MPGRVDFYFDFVSPFTYLALQRVPDLASRFGRELMFHPVDLKQIKSLAGNTAPPTRDQPLKLHYSRIDQRRWAKRYGVPIATPAFYDSSRLNRGFFFASDRGRPRDYLLVAFRKVWGEGGHMLDERLLAAIARELKWEEQGFLDYTLSEEGAQRYSRSTEQAHARHVFGVPTIMVGEEMWWGNDRLDFLEDYLVGDPDGAKPS